MRREIKLQRPFGQLKWVKSSKWTEYFLERTAVPNKTIVAVPVCNRTLERRWVSSGRSGQEFHDEVDFAGYSGFGHVLCGLRLVWGSEVLLWCSALI
jgi:hypothetical protein